MSEDIKGAELPEAKGYSPEECDETGKPYPVCPDCGRRHPTEPEDEAEGDEGWYFYQVVGSTREVEDEIWRTLEVLKKSGAGTKDMAMKMIEEAHKAAEAGDLPKAYLWALITGKVFGLYGV
jgi:hypothetical protein